MAGFYASPFLLGLNSLAAMAQGTGMIAMLVWLYWRKADLRLTRGQFHYLRPDAALLRTVIAKGLPMGAQSAVNTSSAIVMMTMINAYGTGPAAAYAVATQIWYYVQIPAMAIAMSVS